MCIIPSCDACGFFCVPRAAGANRATIYEMSADGGMHVLQASAHHAVHTTRCGLPGTRASRFESACAAHIWPCGSTLLLARAESGFDSSTRRKEGRLAL